MLIATKEKTWVLNFCLFAIRGLRKPMVVTDRVNIHAGEYSTPVKCASEDMISPRSTLRRVYTTPRGITSAFALTTIQKFLSFEQPTTKRQ